MEFCAPYLKWRHKIEVLNRHFIYCQNELQMEIPQSKYYKFYVESMNSFQDYIDSFNLKQQPCSILKNSIDK